MINWLLSRCGFAGGLVLSLPVSAIIGSFLGLATLVIIGSLIGGSSPDYDATTAEWLLIFWAIGALAALLGLILFGLPLAYAFRNWTDTRMIYALAAMLGGLAGAGASLSVADYLSVGRLSGELIPFGVFIGAMTGLVWCRFLRFLLMERARRKEAA